MLYHVPDRAKALTEIRRVLRSGGRFYTATNGLKHMQELNELLFRFAPDAVDHWSAASPLSFRLENGGEELTRWFSHVSLYRYECDLIITEVEPLVNYIRSTPPATTFDSSTVERLIEYFQQELDAHGAIHVSKATGLFEAFGL
jgi:SAM-dependent methyltransferase